MLDLARGGLALAVLGLPVLQVVDPDPLCWPAEIVEWHGPTLGSDWWMPGDEPDPTWTPEHAAWVDGRLDSLDGLTKAP